MWSINYSLHFGSVKIHKICLYWKVFSTEICKKFFFATVYCFSSYFYWAVNYMI